jgi:hypothetical protein
LKIALDLHCHGLRGSWAETIYIVEAKDREISKQQNVFLEILKNENKGILKLHPTRSMIEYGTGWNLSDEKSERLIYFREWASEQDGVSLAATIEIPYANNHGQMVTPKCKNFGKDLAEAIATYLETLGL